MGLNQSTHGTWNTNALINLHLATGAICRLGSGPFSLTGQPNAMGGREMGYMGPGLPGQRSVVDPEDRAFVEKAWGLAEGALSTEVGTGTIDMFQRMVDGSIKACWIICTNPVASVSNRSTVIQGLESCELVIAQDVVRGHRDQRVRGHPAARRAVGRVHLRDGQLRSEPDAPAAGGRPRRRGDARLADHRRGRRAPWATRTGSPTRPPRRSSRRSSSSGTRGPATTCAA